MAARLSFDERARIEALLTVGVGAQQIAQQLGRAVSTIYRELKRNHYDNGGYNALVAQHLTDQSAQRPKQPKLAADRELAEMVNERQMMRWSPHAISADLRAAGHRVCAETIYAACYDRTGQRGLPKESWRLLLRRCRKRKPRNRTARKPNALGDYKPITHRPATVEERREAGHWEGDLIIGANNASAVVTLVERVSRQSRARRVTARSHRQTHRRSSHRSTITTTSASRQNSHLGPRHRNGVLG